MKIVLFFMFLFSFSFAHKLNLFLYEEENKVWLSSYFASGSPCKNCKIEVFNLNKELIKEAKTDEKGEYTINNILPKMIIRVEALGGHAVQKEFEVKGIKVNKKEIKKTDSIFESILAIIIIFLIFFFLKRIKK